MIPEKFKEKMKDVLEGEYDEFIAALEGGEAVRGLRVNLIKTSAEKLVGDNEFTLEPLSYVDNGFILREERAMGASPYHHAGMVYMQDPGAMASAAALDIEPDWWVADLCAAPGGKSSQIAERLGKGGFILSNEYVPKRAKIIVGNLERLGVRNAIVTSLDTARLRDMFCATFDLVVVDAPCSGEGMFRKSEDAVEDWSPENVRVCAERQREILKNASNMVKAGGYLLYSTCTYSKEENEEVVSAFLDSHPEFSLCKTDDRVRSATADGLDGLDEARRFYPHLQKGEGQFIALMKKDEKCGYLPTILYKDSTNSPSKDEIAVINKFFADNLIERPEGRLIKWGNEVAIVNHDCPIPAQSVFMAGVMLGEVKKGVLIPHHQFFSAYGLMMKRQENLTATDERVLKYLRGEEIDTEIGENGFCAILYEDVALGGGKIVNGKIKNHYPKGLRNN